MVNPDLKKMIEDQNKRDEVAADQANDIASIADSLVTTNYLLAGILNALVYGDKNINYLDTINTYQMFDYPIRKG